jgi:hypothetical protein
MTVFHCILLSVDPEAFLVSAEFVDLVFHLLHPRCAQLYFRGYITLLIHHSFHLENKVVSFHFVGPISSPFYYLIEDMDLLIYRRCGGIYKWQEYIKLNLIKQLRYTLHSDRKIKILSAEKHLFLKPGLGSMRMTISMMILLLIKLKCIYSHISEDCIVPKKL